MTKDEFEEQIRLLLQTPEGQEVLLKIMRASPVSKEELQETAAKLARAHGKSMDDALIECIQSDELSESEKTEALKMLGQMPLSWYSDVTN